VSVTLLQGWLGAGVWRMPAQLQNIALWAQRHNAVQQHLRCLCSAAPLPGYYAASGAMALACPADYVCVGGSRSAQPVFCGQHLMTAAGSSDFHECCEYK
jgi:hypothetical protein